MASKYSVSNYDRCNLKIIQINGEELDRAGKAGNHIKSVIRPKIIQFIFSLKECSNPFYQKLLSFKITNSKLRVSNYDSRQKIHFEHSVKSLNSIDHNVEIFRASSHSFRLTFQALYTISSSSRFEWTRCSTVYSNYTRLQQQGFDGVWQKKWNTRRYLVLITQWSIFCFFDNSDGVFTTFSFFSERIMSAVFLSTFLCIKLLSENSLTVTFAYFYSISSLFLVNYFSFNVYCLGTSLSQE